jgi:predicted nucleic-acid-binding protein
MAEITPLIDTNVLVRFLTADPDPKYHNLLPFFKSLESGEIRVELKLIVLFQTLFVLQSFYKVPRESVADSLLSLLEFKGLTVKDKKIVKRMLSLWMNNKTDIVDCYLIACLEKDSRHLLYSYDRGFDRFGTNRKEP